MSTTTESPDLAQIRARVGAVPDPEIPVVTLSELGILRDVRFEAAGQLVVTLTPTYSGCPATEAIASDVAKVLADLGFPDARVQITLSPAWTTDWISDAARKKLRSYGIAPPGRCSHDTQVVQFFDRRATRHGATIRCPRCDSEQTEQISEFGSTPCKALHRCLACREPFDYFKPF